MHAFHAACAIALLVCSLAAQRSGTVLRTLAPRYPLDPSFERFAPFVDVNARPTRTTAAAAGTADFDGDKNIDVWFLGDAGQGGELAVQFANTAGLGRFYRRSGLPTTTYAGVATYRTTTAGHDFLLAIDPKRDQPVLLHWNPRNPKGDPRDGSLGGSDSGWITGRGVFEIACADHPGDGHDDIIVMRDLTQTSTLPLTRVSLLQMGTKRFPFLWVDNTISVDVPVRLERLRVLDLDGDRQTDFFAVAPGFGLVAFRQRPGGFDLHGYWPTQNLSIRDLAVGDFDGNGRDDIAVCLDTAIVTILHHPVGHPLHANGFEYRVFPNPTTIGALHTCAIIGGSRGKLLVGMPRDGQGYVVHPYDPAAYGLIGSWTETSPVALTGPGVTGASLLVADVDNDHDEDLVVQDPAGAHWMTLRHPAVSMAPMSFTEREVGPVANEGTEIEVKVQLPQELINDGVRTVEVGCYVVDPTSPNQNDPEYLFWGRLTPSIDLRTNEATFSVYYWDQGPFDTQVAAFKKIRDINGGAAYVFPQNKSETIRGGPNMFMSLHGVDGTKRYESKNANPKPKKSGSSLGGKWVLKAKPPSLKGDVELLPWE